MTVDIGLLTIEKVFDDKATPRSYVFSLANSVPIPPPDIVLTITSPEEGEEFDEGDEVTITGTLNVAGTVVVKKGAAVLGAATVVGLNWSYSYTFVHADSGDVTFNATATANIGGSTDDASATVDATPAYALLEDPRALAIFEPDNGLSDRAFHSQWGNLVAQGTAVPITGSFDGIPAWQIRAKSATTGYLKTATAPSTATRIHGAVHMYMVVRSAGSPAINNVLASSDGNGNCNVAWWTGTQYAIQAGGSVQFTTTPSSWHLIEVYWHSNFTYYSVDGGAYTKINPSTSCIWGGLVLGAITGGTQASDCDILGIYLFDGQQSETARAALWARLRSRFPTTLTLPASPPAAFSLATAAPAAWDYTQPWDAVIVLGQSNASDYAFDNSSAAWAAGTYTLTNASAWTAGGDPAVAFQWDNPANQTDIVSLDPVSMRGALAGALANALHTSWSRPTVLVPCAMTASAIVAGAASDPQHDWGREIPRGGHKRNSLYWSAVARALEVIRWGGTIRAVVWYQGESEALNASSGIRAAWPAAVQSLIDSFWQDIGLPNPRLNVGDRTRTTVIVRIAGNASSTWTDFRTNVIPTITQNANQKLVDAPVAGPFEVDGVHLRSAPLDTLGGLIATAILAA